MVNGSRVAWVREPQEVLRLLRNARRTGQLGHDTLVTWDPYVGVEVFADGGRVCSPVLVRENLHRLAKVLKSHTQNDLWCGLLDAGVVEYLSKREEEYCIVAPNIMALDIPGNPEYTHVEIDPGVIFGTTAACIPFSDHNQAPRNIYQSSMHKQAIAMPVMNVEDRPTRPLVSTRTGRDPIVSMELPSGISPIVAICCYGGQNQEDSIIMSKSAIERGLGRITSYMTFRADLKQGTMDNELFEKTL